MNSYWHKLATEVPKGIDSHPWMQIFMDTTEQINPEMTEELKSKGDFDDYCRVKVAEAVARYQELIDDGYEEQDAKEEVMAYMFPDDEPMTEDWEMEQAEEEAATEFMRSLGISPDEPMTEEEDEEEDDDEEDDEPENDEDDDTMLMRRLSARIQYNEHNDPNTKRMALQVGQTISKNGATYRLNENHRWERVQGQGGGALQAKQPMVAPGAPQRPMTQSQRPAAPQAQAQPALPTSMPGAAKQKMADTTGNEQKTSTLTSPFQGAHNPRVEADPNHDGVADRARVGVAAFDVPPPPKEIPRIPGLTGMALESESHFAEQFEKNPDQLTDQAVVLFTASASAKGKPPTFETDACKLLSPYWNSTELDSDLARRSQNRATLNTALHQTANAICKRAFIAHLDTMAAGQEILVTVGGCGAGKGYGLEIDEATGKPRVPVAYELAQRADCVWDSAGDQNATENPWILQEARKRGLRVSYIYVHADPKVSWADPKRGVVQRATKPENGRMVDAMVFADSYALGAKNHHAFHESHKHDPDVTFMFLKNGNPPELLNGVPDEALSIDRKELAQFAVDTIAQRTDLPEHVRQGALAGTKIWRD